MKIQAPGAVLELSGDPLGGLGALLEVAGAILWRFSAKMGPRWTQDGPRWQQVAPKMGHDGAKMPILVSVWELLGGAGSIFFTFFAISRAEMFEMSGSRDLAREIGRA